MTVSLRRLLLRRAVRFVAWLSMAGLSLAAVENTPAADWTPRISDTALPSRVVAVDKAQQLFHLYEKKSPLTLKFTYPCTTGQVDGDKLVINDKRTPEGVYFVEYKIASGLDFREYGGIAYTLNYPNPVDRLRGKTGHGIWIHSKGFGIFPKDTRGCIAIGLDEIGQVGPLLTPGTAVVVGERIPTDAIPQRDDGTVRHLRARMDQWTRAWASRSGKLFDFYDAEAYTKAMPESFTAFRSNKERLFKRFAWINIFNRDVQVLEGPGYWVTWSEQFYRAPNLSTEGIRRLYWQRGADNQFRIVGMEWTPRNVGMQAAYEKGQLVASAETTARDGGEGPMPPPLSMPESDDAAPATAVAAVSPKASHAPAGAVPPVSNVPPVSSVPLVPVFSADALQPKPDTAAGIALAKQAEKARLAEEAKQAKLAEEARRAEETRQAEEARQAQWAEKARLAEEARLAKAAEQAEQAEQARRAEEARLAEQARQAQLAEQARLAEEARQAVLVAEAKAAEAKAAAAALAKATPPLMLDNALMAAMQQRLEAWRKAWQNRSPAFFDFYDEARYGTLKDIPHRDNFRALKADMTRRFRAAWIEVVQRPARMEVQNGYLITVSEQLLRVPGQPSVQGVRRLYWQRQDDGIFRIVASHWQQQDVGMEADYLEQTASSVTAAIEAWRLAWEAGDVDKYMQSYTARARQQGKGKDAIREHKQRLWAAAPPAKVNLMGLRVQVEDGGVRADMMQVYRDKTGRGDKGTKTLLLQLEGGQWRIAQEDWAPLPAGAN